MTTSYFYTYNAIFETTISSNSKVVYAYLCKCADKLGKCFPSHKLIGESCSIAITTVKKALAELETAGLIKSQGQARADGGRRVNLYTIIKEGLSGFFSTCTTIFAETLTTKAKLVYLYFSRLSGGVDKVYPAHKTTAKACGLSVGGVRLAINELEENGLVKRQAQYRENKGQKSNIYTLNPCYEIPNTTTPTPTKRTNKETIEENVDELSINDEIFEEDIVASAIDDISLDSKIENQQTTVLSNNNTPHSQNIAPTLAIKRLTELNPIMTNTYNDLKPIIFRKKNLKRFNIYELLYYYKHSHNGIVRAREPCG